MGKQSLLRALRRVVRRTLKDQQVPALMPVPGLSRRNLHRAFVLAGAVVPFVPAHLGRKRPGLSPARAKQEARQARRDHDIAMMLAMSERRDENRKRIARLRELGRPLPGQPGARTED